MCWGGDDGSQQRAAAHAARQREQQRQQQVNQSMQNVDRQFANFTPDYFQQQAQDYQKYYNPQVDEQFNDAREALTLNLARSGNLQSQVGASRLADLTESYNDQRARVAAQAQDYATQRRSGVEQARQGLVQMAQNAANPAMVGNQAMTQADMMRAPQNFSPVGDLFGRFAQLAQNDMVASSKGYPGVTSGLFNNSGASRVVN